MFGSLPPVCGAVTLAALTALPAYADNLLVNPGFEAPPGVPGSQDQTAAGWTFVNNCQRADFNNHTPNGRWMIWGKTFQDVGGGVTQDVTNITAGADYTFSSYLFFENGFFLITDPCNAQLSLTWFNGSNQQIGSPSLLNIPPTTSTPALTWTQFSLNATAPAGAASVRVFVGWDGGQAVMPAQSQSVFFDDVDLEGPGIPPAGGTWVLNGSGDWNVGGNWASGSSPNSVGAEAIFGTAITAAQTVYTNTPVTVGTLRFNNSNTYVLAGAGMLTLDVASGAGLIDVQAGSHKINLPLNINDNTTANVASGATLTIADPLVVAGGTTLTKTGSGTLRIISTVTGSAPAGISIAGGNAQIDYGIGSAATAASAADAKISFTVSGSKAVFGANQTLRGLHAVTAGAGDQEIDLAGHSVRVYSSTPAADELTIYNDIKAARNSASHHDGIYDSTSPASNYTVGVTDQSTDAHGDLSILVRLTRNGDADVNGVVNLVDFNKLASNFNGMGKTWDQGDFNYDGTVNLLDFNLLAGNFNQVAAGFNGEPTPQDWANLATAVPEPTSTLALGGFAVAAMARRRRRA